MANKSLEELLAETEQRIMNNEFKKTFTLTYDGEDYDFIFTTHTASGSGKDSGDQEWKKRSSVFKILSSFFFFLNE